LRNSGSSTTVDVSGYWKSTDELDYVEELNDGHDLEAEDVIRRLRWKDRRMLTYRLRIGGPTPVYYTYTSIYLLSIHFIMEAWRVRQDYWPHFPNGIVWQLFLFHIARPWEWPIADQHAFRVYSLLLKVAAP